MITILLVDDQNLVQQGIKSLLDQDLRFKVIGTVTDGRSAIEKINRLRPDIVLLDIEMPGMDGITTTKYINHLSPKTKVIILSSHEDKKFVTQALVAGAKGYILKTSLMQDLRQAILAVHNGYSQVESRLLAQVFHPDNIRTKIKKSSSEGEEINNQNDESNNLIIEEPQEIISNRNSQEIKLDNQESANIQNYLKTPKASPSVLLEKVDPEIIKTNSLPLEEESQQTEDSSALILEEDNLPPDQSLLLEQDAANLTQHQERSLINENLSDLTPIPEHPLTEYKPVKANQSKLEKSFFQVLDYVKGLGNQPKIFRYKNKILRYYKFNTAKYAPQISQFKSILIQYKDRLSLLIKHWHNKRWLWNISLMIFGAVIVLILHN